MESDRSTSRKTTACPKCGNRLRIWAEQVAAQVVCPKCSATFTVNSAGSVETARPLASPATADRAEPPMPSEDDLYQPEVPLTRSLGAPEEAMIDLGPGAGAKWQQMDWDGPDDSCGPAPSPQVDYLAAAKAMGLVREPEIVYRPRYTFLSDVFGFPWKGPNVTRWAGMSIGLVAAGMLFVQTGQLIGLWGTMSQAAVGGILLIVVTVLVSIVTGSLTAASFVAAVQDTAEGHRDPQESNMPEWHEWIFILFGMLSIATASAAIGYPLSLAMGPSALLLFGLLLFPVLILSAMEVDSFFAPISRAVIRTLTHSWGAWLAFYLLTSVMIACLIVPFAWFVRRDPYLTIFFAGPVAAAMTLIYARLLGRVAWSALAGLPTSESDEREPAPARRKRKKKRGHMRLEFPGESEALEYLDIATPPRGLPPR